MKTIHFDVADKVATYNTEDGAIVCGNADYQAEFAFDDEWNAHSKKTAVIIADNKRIYVDFTGNICPLPMVSRVKSIGVGVIVAGELATTRADVPCIPSIACNTAPKEPIYNVVPKVSGVWVFNETLSAEKGIKETVSFINGSGTPVLKIEVSLSGGIVLMFGSSPIYYAAEWEYETNRTVDFGTTAQEVSEEFYTWLTANAVKQ